MRRLNTGNHAKCFQSRQIGGMDGFDMLDAVPAVARAIGFGRRRVAIKRSPDCAVGNGMDTNL